MPDEYGQVRPGHPTYRQDCAEIGRRLALGHTMFVAFAHAGGRTNLVLCYADTLKCVGARPSGVTGDYLFVAIENKGAYWFRGPPVSGYVASKLGIDDVTAEGLAEFLALVGPVAISRTA